VCSVCPAGAMCGSKSGDKEEVRATYNRAEEIDQSKTYNEEKEYAVFNFHFGTAATMGLIFLGFVAIVIVSYLVFKRKSVGCCRASQPPVQFVPAGVGHEVGHAMWGGQTMGRVPVGLATAPMARSPSEVNMFSGGGDVVYGGGALGQTSNMLGRPMEVTFVPRGSRELTPSYTGACS
jgi:hypothetical protein